MLLYVGLLFFVEELFRKSDIEIDCKLSELIRFDCLSFCAGYAQYLDKDSGRFFCCVYQAECQIKVFFGRKRAMMGQMVRSYFFISSLVFTAISRPPGTIHSTRLTPSEKTTGHSVAISHSFLVNTSSSTGRWRSL